MKPFRILLAVVLAASASLAHAQCPAKHEAMGERLFKQGGASYRVQLCWNLQGFTGGSLLVQAYQGEQLVAETTVPMDVEGQVRAIRFDRANYPLSDEGAAFPVLVETRSHGATFDQYTTDLWLFTLESRRLRKVFSQNVDWRFWVTQCESDCVDTTETKTVVIIGTEKSSQGLHDLKLRTRGKTTPYGRDETSAQTVDQTTRYVFNGEEYEQTP
ncbi:hypothetical protein [Dyella subtropica]|uniref:hypothetical protein n=1 Tax=Dyella subtropica TaxID=2992127 RepID=UPI002256A1E3|nr:hypothetical protein [Dyella subtropica]